MSHTYKHTILGGTFDHFHIGHEQFIKTAFDQAEQVTIGIVEKLFLTKKSFSESIEEYSLRLSNLKLFLNKQNFSLRTNIIPINDIYATTLTDQSIEAIFVTDSTFASAEKINQERQKRAMSKLEIIQVPYFLGDDDQVISSRRIRGGEINRQGKSYSKFFLQKETYLLPVNLRETLQRPMGIVVSSPQKVLKLIPPSSYIISIGDIVSMGLKKASCHATISIIDYQTRRHAIDKKTVDQYFPVISDHLVNPAGTINKDIAEILTSLLGSHEDNQDTKVIAVAGEEDLLALPAMLFAPLDSYVIYGQYNIGMCVVKVTEDIKDLAKQYLRQF